MISIRRKNKTVLCVLLPWVILIYVFYIRVQKIENKLIVIDIINSTREVQANNVIIINTDNDRNSEVRRNASFSIGAVLVVRVYRGDKPELTTYEIEQWIRYMQYAGVDEVYLYDTYEQIEEKLENWTKKLFEPTEVFYHDWHNKTPYGIEKTQVTAYQHSIDNYKDRCEWHVAMDMDEYPFVINDTKQGFLKRLIRSVLSDYPKCVEISFPNYLFSGHPQDYDWLIERLQRRLPNRFNNLDKPMYRARNISKAGVHHNGIAGLGRQSVDINSNIARMNHYWGARLQNWEPDTNKTLSETIEDPSIIPILLQLKRKPLISNKIPAYVTNRYWNV